MTYTLVKSSNKDIDKLMEYKKNTIYEYAKDLSNREKKRIDNYIKNEVPKSIKDYYNIVIDNKIIGCVLLEDKDDGKILDELYLEEEYRNKGIGSDIIKNIQKNNSILYLWVYKDNKKAISLYKRLMFNIILETETRYYMKYKKEGK